MQIKVTLIKIDISETVHTPGAHQDLYGEGGNEWLVAGPGHSSVRCDPVEDAWPFPWNIFQPGHPAYGRYGVTFKVHLESYLTDSTFRSNPNCEITNSGP